ncbi:MAG: hypothetical protein ABFD76_03350 [Smithella sp.]
MVNYTRGGSLFYSADMDYFYEVKTLDSRLRGNDKGWSGNG